MDKLSVGVVGAGVFGGYHSNKCTLHPDVNFVGVYDPDEERCAGLAKKHGVKAFNNFDDFLGNIDAAIIACPARFHADMALKALEVDKHVLIEKPIAHDLELAKAILAMSEKKKRVVQIGHQERYVMKAIGLDQVEERPLSISAKRLSPRSKRGTDVSVTLDLMTHDLDLVFWLMKGDAEKITGDTKKVYSGFGDMANAKLTFNDSRVADLEASRTAEASFREMIVSYESGDVTIDFNAKTLVNETSYKLNDKFGQDPQAKDSLGAALDGFIAAILTDHPVLVSAADGVRALDAALKIDKSK